MPFKTRYVFVVTMDVDADKEALFNEVYDQEHVPNLLRVPGVVAVTRGRKKPARFAIGGELKALGEGEPRYVACYEIDSPDVLNTDAWAQAVEAGRWGSEVRPHTRNRHHVLYEMDAGRPTGA